MEAIQQNGEWYAVAVDEAGFARFDQPSAQGPFATKKEAEQYADRAEQIAAQAQIPQYDMDRRCYVDAYGEPMEWPVKKRDAS